MSVEIVRAIENNHYVSYIINDSNSKSFHQVSYNIYDTRETCPAEFFMPFNLSLVLKSSLVVVCPCELLGYVVSLFNFCIRYKYISLYCF